MSARNGWVTSMTSKLVGMTVHLQTIATGIRGRSGYQTDRRHLRLAVMHRTGRMAVIGSVAIGTLHLAQIAIIAGPTAFAFITFDGCLQFVRLAQV